MIHIILNKPSDPAGPLHHSLMKMEVFKHTVGLLDHENERNATVHAEHIPAEKLFAYISAVNNHRIYAEYYLGSPGRDDAYRFLTEHPIPMILDADYLASLRDSQLLKQIKKSDEVKIFFPLGCSQSEDDLLKKILGMRLSVKEIVLGVGWQKFSDGPGEISRADHRAWAKLLLSMANRMTHKKTPFRFLCGLPLCLFSRNQLGKMATGLAKWPLARCHHALVVEPDGNLSYCYKIQGYRSVNIMSQASIADLRKELNQLLLSFKSYCPLANASCRSLRTRACGGVCLAQTLAGWQGGNTPNLRA